MEYLINKLMSTCKVDRNVPLSKLTTLRIGGIADAVVYPTSYLALIEAFTCIVDSKIPYKVLGKGSNVLCSDEPFHGIIIKLDRSINDFYFTDTNLIASAGCSIIHMSTEAMKRGLSGLEFASGIPATVGGTCFMNAGAYKSHMKDVIEEVLILKDKHLQWITHEECQFNYRTSIFHHHRDWLIVAVKYRLEKSNSDDIRETMDSRRKRRLTSQPLEYPSAGSVFKNPENNHTWKIIENLGYRGKQIGGAKVSEKHTNFIINVKAATATDFLSLVEEIQRDAKNNFNEELVMEVEKFNFL